MAKKCMVLKNERRQKAVDKYAERRKELKALISSPKTEPVGKEEAVHALDKLPRDGSAVRLRNRCSQTGRPRGFLRRFGLSRLAFRELALKGQLPGIRKSSW
jgi:small subunit ribosomal protein S14